MKKVLTGFLLTIFIVNLASSQVKGIIFKDPDKSFYKNSQINKRDGLKTIYLHKTEGNLRVTGNAVQSPYTVYFVVPIAYKEQAPIWFEIDCPQLIDYKYIRLSDDNVVVAASLNNHPDTIHLNWTSWVLIKHHRYTGIPPSVPIPAISELPDSVISWLRPTACVQWTDSSVNYIADSIRGITNDALVLANKICDYCYNIPWEFPHQPYSFDAYYAMKWGNSCTGRAHAAAAIFRANNIPCRVLLNMLIHPLPFDMHWIIEYFVPDYGWIKMETSLGNNPYFNGHNAVITLACNIEDEFSITYPDNLESYWFGSDTVFNHMSPDWNVAHSASQYTMTLDTASRVDQIISFASSIFKYNSILKGINLNDQQSNAYDSALLFQYHALENAKDSNIDSLIINLNEALNYLWSINIDTLEDVYFNNFESGLNDWTHGGIRDKWDVGTPTVGPTNCYSGTNCIGSNLDSIYSNNVNSWIESPSIDLTDLSCAYLNFKIWNDVEDDIQGKNPRDRLWVELSLDNGQNYFPISTCFGGVNDDPAIPSFGGWNNVVLDLSDFINTMINIRFHFTSNDTISKIGSYIDDFRVYGRKIAGSAIEDIQNSDNYLRGKCFPNPFINKIEIEYSQPYSDDVQINVFNIAGQEIYTSNMLNQSPGIHKISLNTSNYESGIYHIRINTCHHNLVFKIVKL